MTLAIRKARPSDLAQIQVIARDAVNSNYRLFLVEESVDWFISGPSDDYLAAQINQATVACLGENVVGFTVLNENRIDLIMVKNEQQQQGIGSKLLSYSEARLFILHGTIKLESFEKNERANNFYHKNNWLKSHIECGERDCSNKLIFIKQKYI
ncbi:MAG: ribosomal protein S18 acetylase RimI-like enzyme [Moritella sp.]|jgi:ribosomal protein S18 acetylase RimI-like enzyme